ncbi:MAG: hypothetical protein IPG64_16370 [Haliea sp.]|nr:hypothetical protein [Haliea sp.]
MPKIAIAQLAPVFLDRDACLTVAVAAIEQAAGNGASLIVFPEAFITGYPAWIWRLRPGVDEAACASLHKSWSCRPAAWPATIWLIIQRCQNPRDQRCVWPAGTGHKR